MPDPCNCEQAQELTDALDRIIEVHKPFPKNGLPGPHLQNLRHAVAEAEDVLKRWNPGTTVTISRYLASGETADITVVLIDGAVHEALDLEGNHVRLSDVEEQAALRAAGQLE